MDPAHYETQLNIHFEYVEGYIKALKKKNITDEEREKVKKKKIVVFCARYKLISRKEKKNTTQSKPLTSYFLYHYTLLSRVALFPTFVSHPFN